MVFRRGVQSDGTWWVYAGDENREYCSFLAGGNLWDLTGCTIEAQARKVDTDPVAAITAVVEMTDPANGRVHISWDGEDVRTLLAGQSTWEGVYDIQVLEAGRTQPRTVVRAVWHAQMDVTRADV